MIQLKDGRLRPELLDKNGTLSEGIISQYDYIELKNDFEEIVDILETNKLVHALYQEYLNYEIGEDLEFKIVADNIPNITITDEKPGYPEIVSDTDTHVITLDRKAYDTSLAMCAVLLKRVKMSLQLNIRMVKKRESDDYLKQLIAENYIISIPPDDRKKIGKM